MNIEKKEEQIKPLGVEKAEGGGYIERGIEKRETRRKINLLKKEIKKAEKEDLPGWLKLSRICLLKSWIEDLEKEIIDENVDDKS
jgi:hypothetical protein